MKKRFTAISTALVMAAGTITGCGSGSTNTENSSTQTTAAQTETASGTAGEDTGRPKLVIGIQSNSFVTDYSMGKNALTTFVADYNGVDLEIYQLPSETSEVRTKLSLLVAAPDTMPDVIFCPGALANETILDYGSKGAFIPLNKYLENEELTPHFNAVLPEDKELMLDTMVMADGNVYSYPRYQPEYWNLTPFRLYTNKVWLDKLGLEVPKTTDELYDVLVAFRDNDPNGNGVQDEIGVYGDYDGFYGENTVAALINAFTFFNNFEQNGGLALAEDGKTVIAPFVTPEFQDAMRYLNKLYEENLLAASMFTDDQQQFRAVLNNEVNLVGLTSAGSHSNWPDVNNNPNFIELCAVPPLTGPKGVCYTPTSSYVPELGAFITSNCKDPELAVRFVDSFLSPEISDFTRYGEKGVDWTDDPEELKKTSNAYVQAGIYDSLRLAYLTNIWNEPQAQEWHNANPRYATLENGSRNASLNPPYDPDLPSAPYQAFSFEQYYPRRPENLLPLLKYTVDEAMENAETITNVTEHTKQAIAEFVTGARDVDAGWDQYLAELNNMGLEHWLSCAQAAYDRQQ